MTVKDLRMSPQCINKEDGWWWYEERKGIYIVAEIRDHDGSYIRTENMTIPWKRIRSALDRLDKETP